MHWEDLPEVISAWFVKTADVGHDIRRAVADVICSSHVGYYCNPVLDYVGIFAPMANVSDTARTKSAMDRACGHESVPLFLTYQDLCDPHGSWVKVAYSQTLHRAGELLNFFPGQYPGGIPNAPSPVASMLTSGLVGAGLGWGGGKLLGAVLPKGYGKKLSRTGMILGGLGGMAPGAAWAGTNLVDGRSFNDPSILDTRHAPGPGGQSSALDGTNMLPPDAPGPNEATETLERTRQHLQNVPLPHFKMSEALDAIELGTMYKTAAEKVSSTFGGYGEQLPPTPSDVNIDHLGRTLWDTGASPALAATTMSSMYAAQQLPDPHSRPGWVTGHQLGQLASNAVGDYVRGYVVGAALNTVVGTPFRSSTFGSGNAILGVISAVVPKLFGG